MSVLRLALDTHDPVQRYRIEAMFAAGYQLYRAVQRNARDRARAYWAASQERARDPSAVRARLGLSRPALERAAYAQPAGDGAGTPRPRFWERRLAGLAIDREARTVAAIAGGRGGALRAATRPTALSQHCPCGARVRKRLAERIHACPVCGLCGDRDAVAAVLASFVVLDEPGEPASARVDYTASADALRAIGRALTNSPSGWQDTLSESTGLSAREGSFLTWQTSTPGTALRRAVVARRTVGRAPCPTLHETGTRRTTAEQARMRANLASTYDLASYLRDSS